MHILEEAPVRQALVDQEEHAQPPGRSAAASEAPTAPASRHQRRRGKHGPKPAERVVQPFASRSAIPWQGPQMSCSDQAVDFGQDLDLALLGINRHGRVDDPVHGLGAHRRSVAQLHLSVAAIREHQRPNTRLRAPSKQVGLLPVSG